MTPEKLATLRPGDLIAGEGAVLRVTSSVRRDSNGNPFVWALTTKNGSITARISVRDCDRFKIRRRAARG